MAQPGRTGDVTAVGQVTSLQGVQHQLGLNLVSEMLSNEAESVSYSKLVRLDVVRCRRLNRQGVTESRTKENGTYPIPEGGKRMTLIELSIKNWKKCCIFKRRKMKISPIGLLFLLSMAVITWLRQICSTSLLCLRGPLFWIIQGLTKAEALRGTRH